MPGSYSILRDYIRPKRTLRPSRATVRFETEPGHQMQSDWAVIQSEIAGRPTTVAFIVNTLGFSRRIHFWCSHSTDAEHTYEGLIRAFEWFGGVPHEVLVDNQKAAVLEHPRGGLVQFHPRFLDLAGHYGFVPKACRPARAQTKGKDERMVGYIKHHFFVRYRQFESRAHLNQVAEHWLREEADQRRHGTVHVAENCSSYALTYRDVVNNQQCTGDCWKTITSTWTAVDASSYRNVGTCVQTICFKKLAINGLAWPSNYDGLAGSLSVLEGKGPWDVNGNNYPDVTETGKPGGDACNIQCTWRDEVIKVCGDDASTSAIEGTFKVLRFCTCLDWCTGETATHLQIIKVGDHGSPVVACPVYPTRALQLGLGAPGNLVASVGGTGWLYLSAVPFEQLGFRTDLGTTPYPEYTKEFLYSVPILDFGLPTMLVGLKLLTDQARRKEGDDEDGEV